MGARDRGTIRHVGVIDIGKTNAKVAAVDLKDRLELGVLKCPNRVLAGPSYPHYDIEALWRFILDGLAELNRAHPLDALSITTHGASLVLLDNQGHLAAPVLDYEHDGPDDLSEAYNRVRPPFADTGSPRLPIGLNAGAQLFWQLQTQPGLEERLATVLTYPQYWAYRLTGVCACEATSLGCHTDLWCPESRTFSSLVTRLGLEGRMAPVRKAGEVLGEILPSVAEDTGLPQGLPVVCGIHDSNASLYPYLLQRQGAFSVISTGTWVIVFAVGGKQVDLDPRRDTLINVNGFGEPVPSARFMGGREYELGLGGRSDTWSTADLEQVLARNVMLFPSLEPRSGPFQGRKSHWSVAPETLSDGEVFVALSIYLALMTAECLEISGAAGASVVEGPLASNEVYLRMLEALTGRPVEASGGSVTGTSVGAALLLESVDPTRRRWSSASTHRPRLSNAVSAEALVRYGTRWRELVGTADCPA